MKNISGEVAGDLIIYSLKKAYSWGFKKMEELKKFGIKDFGLKKPCTLGGNYTEDRSRGYGKVSYLMLVENNSSISKYIESGDIRIKISNFKPIEFKHLLYDYKFKSGVLTDNFQVYGLNNGTNIVGDNVEVAFRLSDDTLIMKKNIRIDLKAGEIKELAKFYVNNEVKLIDSVKKTENKLLYVFVDGYPAMVLKLNDNRFNETPESPPVLGLIERDISICIADFEVLGNQEETIKNPVEIKDRFTVLKINFFPKISSSFEFSITYKDEEVAKEEASVLVPFFEIDDINTRRFEYPHQYEKYDMTKYHETNKINC